MSGLLRFLTKQETSTEPIAEPELPPVQKSLALNVLLRQLKEGRKYNILDLGPAVGRNIEFFSQFSCKVFIEDFFDTLTSFDYMSPEDGFSLDTVFSYLLPFQKGCLFDFVLAWDLFNYLERDVFRSLMEHLGKFCHRGTLLLGLIATSRHIPESPYRFQIVDSENLIYQPQSTVLRNCPRYESSDLDQLLPRFRVYNSFFLRNGYREYLFIYQ